MKQKQILYITIIILFITLNYTIIAYGHSQTYDKENNNCTHMSSQLEGMFEAIGIPTTIKAGSREDGGRHMWIKIGWLELDSINLLPFQNNNYNQRIVEYMSFDEYAKTRI